MTLAPSMSFFDTCAGMDSYHSSFLPGVRRTLIFNGVPLLRSSSADAATELLQGDAETQDAAHHDSEHVEVAFDHIHLRRIAAEEGDLDDRQVRRARQ